MLPDVYSAQELARASGLTLEVVRDLIAAGRISTVDGEFVAHRHAVAALRAIGAAPARLTGSAPAAAIQEGERLLFAPVVFAARSKGLPLLASTAFHLAAVAAVIVATTVGLTSSETDVRVEPDPRPVRMVYLATPGPGGGGGGGGLRQRLPPPKAEREGPPKKQSSPLPRREAPRPIEPAPKPVEPEKPAVLKHEPLPPIIAPIASVPSDLRDRAGVLEETTARADSRGSGNGGGVGTGRGTGIGEGDGPGVGPGSGGGTGGGPYRPGSGIQPPRLVREVKPQYTEEARQRSVEGEVLLEIVVRHDGSVGNIRIVRRLGFGLDDRAVDAVRQWRFAPARRLGTPVDVVVEVAVEFRLR